MLGITHQKSISGVEQVVLIVRNLANSRTFLQETGLMFGSTAERSCRRQEARPSLDTANHC